MKAGKLAAALALTLLAALPARAQDTVSPADWDKVVAAAKQEGKVVVYNAVLGAPYYYNVAKAFTAKYGIAVDTLDLRASELSARLQAEQASGKFLGDVEQRSEASLDAQMKQGWLQQYKPFPNLKNVRKGLAYGADHAPAWIQAYGWLVNSSMVTPDQQPHVWKDLLDPKWKGKMLFDDPRAAGAGVLLFAVANKVYGPDYVSKLAAQDLQFDRDLRNDSQRVARGEFPLYAPTGYAFASDLAGLPVRLIVPDDGSIYIRVDNGMLKNAPHPNAARLFMDFMLEPDTQLTYANGLQLPVIDGVAERASDQAKPFAASKLLGTVTDAEQQAMLAQMAKTFK